MASTVMLELSQEAKGITFLQSNRLPKVQRFPYLEIFLPKNSRCFAILTLIFMKTLFVVALLLSVSDLLHAELVWESKRLEYYPTMAEKTVEAVFQFTNTATNCVTIDSVRSSCGCTTVGLEKKQFNPGEKGRIRAIFSIGRRQGILSSAISVTVHGEAQPVILTIVTHVPELMKIEPLSISWEVGATAQPKTIKLTASPSDPLRVTAISSDDPRILTSFKAVKPGSEYTLEVTPTDTARMAMATLTIEAVSQSNQPRVFQAFAKIKRSGPWLPPPR